MVMKTKGPFIDSKRVIKNVFVLLVLTGAVSMVLVPARAQAGPYDAYLMAHFTGESSNYGEQIYFAISTDGLHWTDINNSQPVLTSNIGDGGVRDPSIIRSADGTTFWILATDLCIGCGTSWSDAQHNGSTSLVIWESSDLVNWSGPRLANVAGSIPDAGCAWAPEAIYDEDNENYVVYWATISPLDGYDKARIYYATTTDFVNFSAPQMYINRPGAYGIIDTQILKVANSTYQYYRVSRDTYNGYDSVTVEGNNSIFSSWTEIGDIHGLVSSWSEGPILYKFNDANEWCLMVDVTAGGYLPLVSTDLSDMDTYRVLSSSEYSLGTSRKRHGSILNITTAELNAILEKWPLPTIYPGDIIESYNYPGYFFNHEGVGRDSSNQARIVEGADSLASGQWNIVPGLKDPAGISFESVEHPGHYLRHYAYVLYLNAYDSSDLFKQDATFYVQSGWADSGSVSFKSYNFPSRYIRHSSLGLQIDPVDSGSSNGTKEDATFDIVINPPAAPTSLTAVSGIGHVNLDWDGNIESDLDSYQVCRSQTSGGPYSLIQNVAASEYLDDSVNNGTLYYYAVTATDTSGNVSDYSDEDSALPPDLTDDDKIDFADLAKVAEVWLTTYDINDLSAIAENWLIY
jgi:hypothetical protein